MVNSTTPRLGPRWPPVCERTLISSSRTSWASCGKSCSRIALTSAGPRTPSSRRVPFLEESDVIVILFLPCIRNRRGNWRFRRCKIFHRRFAGMVAGDDLNLLLGVGETVLANLHQFHSLLITHQQVFQQHFP